ncbi:hypothetical protein GCM10010873_06230 [Cypionkella aquatica]|uniref:Uncharacterized protein n=1 Tax=Cypionkella aquatica TaxID=1756042 RepID=A0AA37TTQ6_9RHOB|nr:hypothetical protein GCM10010873_06230 [Cypionkella aquatica]
MAAHAVIKRGHHGVDLLWRDRKTGEGVGLLCHFHRFGDLVVACKDTQSRRGFDLSRSLSYKARMDRIFARIFRIISPAL